MNLKEIIRAIPDYPKPGIMFRDITTLLSHDKAFPYVIDQFKERYQNENLSKIVGVESRGFILGSTLAYALNVGFVPIRKKGKLPSKTLAQEYALEYGTDTVEIHEDALEAGEKILLIDDLMATGGTALASLELLKKLDAQVHEVCMLIDLPGLGGSKKVQDEGYRFHTLIDF